MLDRLFCAVLWAFFWLLLVGDVVAFWNREWGAGFAGCLGTVFALYFAALASAERPPG